jgi:DNA-binding NtrC family response regulator
MGQILIIHDDGETGASLGSSHSTVHAAGLGDLRRLMQTQTFDTAILAGGNAAEMRALMSAIREADRDLAIVLVAAAAGADGDGTDFFRDHSDLAASDRAQEQVWEVLPRPVAPGVLRRAVERARQHTVLSRENGRLRSQLERGDSPESARLADAGRAIATHQDWIALLPPRLDLRALLASVEKSVIQRTLEATSGAQAEAARRLGLSRSDLSYKLAKYELRKRAAPEPVET